MPSYDGFTSFQITINCSIASVRRKKAQNDQKKTPFCRERVNFLGASYREINKTTTLQNWETHSFEKQEMLESKKIKKLLK